MIEQELAAAALGAARALAQAFGLGDEVQPLDEWPVEQGDSVIAVRLGPDDVQLCLAVNDDVADRLSAAPDVLEEGIRAAVGALDAALRTEVPLSVLGVDRTSVTRPDVVAGITDQGTLTALVGLSASLATNAAPAAAETAPQASPPPPPAPADAASFQPGVLAEADGRGARAGSRPLAVLHDVDLLVTAELGRTTMPVRELLDLAPGMVVEIDRAAGAPIDLLVNGRRIASGEVVVIDEEFGVRITEILEGDLS
ncbi:MAG: flagellar motor switch protein FliN [Ilumatobacteraceae bacterium]